MYKAQIEFFDDGPVKPVRIWSRIGRRPRGRRQLQRRHRDAALRRGAARTALRLLVLHDDADREFDYDDGAERAIEEAKTRTGR